MSSESTDKVASAVALLREMSLARVGAAFAIGSMALAYCLPRFGPSALGAVSSFQWVPAIATVFGAAGCFGFGVVVVEGLSFTWGGLERRVKTIGSAARETRESNSHLHAIASAKLKRLENRERTFLKLFADTATTINGTVDLTDDLYSAGESLKQSGIVESDIFNLEDGTLFRYTLTRIGKPLARRAALGGTLVRDKIALRRA